MWLQELKHEVVNMVQESEEFVHHQHHVLLVDDDPVTLRAVEQLLKKAGYRVSTALSGKEAMHILEASRTSSSCTPVDLILTDVLMPGAPALVCKGVDQWTRCAIHLDLGLFVQLDQCG